MRKTFIAAFALAAATSQAQNVSSEDLARRTIERRAVDAVIWGMPAVNTQLLYDATEAAGGNFNQVVYWSRLIGWKNQTLTPNPDTIYFFPFYDLKEGAVVLEIPPAEEGSSITGSIDDAWQTAIEDVGPAGVDKGNGGKYLLLPPGYEDPVPAGHCRRQLIRALSFCDQISKAPATRMSKRPSPTASASISIRFPKRTIPLQPRLSTQLM